MQQNQQLPTGMFQEDAEKIQRRRALLASVMAQAQPRQGQMVGGQYIRGNGLGQVAALVAGAMMGKDKTPDMEEAARARYQQSLRDSLTGYFDKRDGRAGEVMDDQQAQNLMENDVAPQLAEPVKANPREAVIGALSSRHPELQALGQADLGRMGPKQLDPRFIKEYEGQFFDLSSGKPVPLGGARFGETTTINGDLYQVGPNGQLRKLDNAPKISVHNIPAAAGQTEYEKAVGKAIAPGGDARKDAEAARTGLRSSVEALTAIKDGAKMGIAEPALQVVRKLAAQAGFPQAETAPTETLSMVLKQSIFNDLGGLGAQISDGDRSFVQDFTGDITKDPAALKRMLALRIAGQMQRAIDYNKQVDSFSEKSNDPFIKQEARRDLNITIPDNDVANMVDNILQGRESTTGLPHLQGPRGAPAANPSAQKGTAANPLTWEEYMARQRGSR
jgi:hypothetical protein